MTDITGMHAPTPEFRAALEAELVRALHRDERLAPSSNARFGRRFRTAATLAAGLILGVGTNFAAGQVQDSRQRDTLASSMTAGLMLAQARLQLAQSNSDRIRKSFDAGAVSRSSLLAAEVEVRVMRSALAKLEIDMQEVRASAAPPRNELWAPLIGGRDYVKERLEIDIATAHEKLTALGEANEEAFRAYRAGVITRLARGAAENEMWEGQEQLEVLLFKKGYREEFIKRGVTNTQSIEELTRKVKRAELEREIRHAERMVKLSRDRLEIIKARQAVGAAEELEMKRAELDALERTFTLEKLRLEIAVLDRAGK